MKTNLLLLFLISVLCSSCLVHYGLANFATESAYVPKPICKDTTVSSTYVTATYYNSDNAYKANTIDQLISQMGNFGITRSTLYKDIYFAYGGNVYMGNIETAFVVGKNGNIEEGNRDYHGGGLFGSFGLNSSYARNHFMFGTKVSIQYERGEFAAFRLALEPYRIYTPDDISANVSISMEWARHFKQGNWGIYNNVGIGHHAITAGSTVFLTIKSATIQSSFNWSLVAGRYWGTGLAYRLPSLSKKKKTSLKNSKQSSTGL